MADELEKELGARPKLIEGKGGVFEVILDGALIFSKKQLERFPEEGEVLGLARAAQGA